MPRGIFVVFTLIVLALLVGVVGPVVFFYNQNAVDNNLTVTGDDAGAFGYYKDMGHMEANFIGSLSGPAAWLLIGLALLICVLVVFVAARRMRA